MKLQLSRGEAHIKVIYGEKFAIRACDGCAIPKRTTTLRIMFAQDSSGSVTILQQTVSCSHLDQFSRWAGRREAMRKIFRTDPGLLSHEDRAAIAVVLLNVPRSNKPPPQQRLSEI